MARYEADWRGRDRAWRFEKQWRTEMQAKLHKAGPHRSKKAYDRKRKDWGDD